MRNPQLTTQYTCHVLYHNDDFIIENDDQCPIQKVL